MGLGTNKYKLKIIMYRITEINKNIYQKNLLHLG